MNLKDKYILGVSCGYHDSAASLVLNGKVLSAVEEERFTGIKHDSSYPTKSIEWILSHNELEPSDISYVCFYEDPDLKVDRVRKTSSLLSTKPSKVERYYKKTYDRFKKDFPTASIVSGNHHESHISYSYHTSPFNESVILSVDGVGEWETTSISIGKGNHTKKVKSINFPHSLGMLYSTITAFLGFEPNEGEYKVMGLAPYGDFSVYDKQFEKLYELYWGEYKLNMKYFEFEKSDKIMFNSKMMELFEMENRFPEDEIEQKHKDLAATLQYHYETILLNLLNYIQNETGITNLCLGGGCAYNGTANGKIKQKTKFENLWIPPAPSDAGSAIGVSLHFYYVNENPKQRVINTNPFLGPSYTDGQILDDITKYIMYVGFTRLDDDIMIERVSKLINDGSVIGWFEGELEFGARALGHRSILANPTMYHMRDRVNQVVKKREGFRPFAPMVTYDDQSTYFDYTEDVPYMNQVVQVNKKYQKSLPSITHIDGSARIQTVRENNKRIYKLLKQFEKDSGFPILLNTSFNLKGQTMVNDPKTAIETFLKCDMDYLVLGNYLVRKI